MAHIATLTRAYLLANAPVAALIATRMYPLLLPQNAVLPAVTYQVISDVHELNQSEPGGLPVIRLQYTCWADSYLAAQTLAAAIRVALDGFTGVMGSGSVGYAALDNMVDDYEPDTKKYRVLVDMKIQRSE